MGSNRRHFGWACLLVLAGCGPSSLDAPRARLAGGFGTTRRALTTFRGIPISDYDPSLPDVDAIGYDVTLRLVDATPGRESFGASVEATLVATRDLDSVSFDFAGNVIDSVTVDGRSATSTRARDQLTITLPDPVEDGSPFKVRFDYHGVFSQRSPTQDASGLSVYQRNSAGRRIFLSYNWPSDGRKWIPLRDHPRDGALFAMRATFPSAFTVFANGERTELVESSDGMRTWQYLCDTSMPTYDFHLAAYDDWVVRTATPSRSGLEIRTAMYSGDVARAAPTFTNIHRSMDSYEALFGPYQWSGLTYLEEAGVGGMEHATVISLDERYFATGASQILAATHEMGHHWAGNLVRIAKWNEFWLSEGFVDYMTQRVLEDQDSNYGARVRRYYHNLAIQTEWRMGPAQVHFLRPPDEVDVLTIFDSVTYKKGALVLRMLEKRIGRQVFTDFLRGWYADQAGAYVTTEEFRDAVAMVTNLDVEGFFDQWVFNRYHPVLDVRTAYDTALHQLRVTVDQVQPVGAGPAEGFTFPLELELVTGTVRQRVTIDVGSYHSAAALNVASAPDRVFVDPDLWTYASVLCDTARPCASGFACRPPTGTPTAEGRSICLWDGR